MMNLRNPFLEQLPVRNYGKQSKVRKTFFFSILDFIDNDCFALLYCKKIIKIKK